MTPGPTLLKECNKCGGLSWTGTFASTNTFGAKFWPDGKMDAPMQPDEHWLVLCGHCNYPIWADETKEIDGYWSYKQLSYVGYRRYMGVDKEWNERSRNRFRPRSIDDFDNDYEEYEFEDGNPDMTWEEQTDYEDKRREAWGNHVDRLIAKYPNTKEYKTTTIADLQDTLKQNTLTLKKEVYIRLRLMRLYNDVNRDNPEPQPASEDQYANWAQLIKSLSDESTPVKQKIPNIFLIAEVYREMGKFKEALETLNKWPFEKFSDKYEREIIRKNRLVKLCENQDARVQVIPDE